MLSQFEQSHDTYDTEEFQIRFSVQFGQQYVHVEGQSGHDIDHIDRRFEILDFARTECESHNEFEGKPNIGNDFDVSKSLMHLGITFSHVYD